MIQIDWKPQRRQLRTFGLVGTVAFGLLAGLTAWRGGLLGLTFPAGVACVATWVLAGLAGVCFALAVICPKGLWPLYIVLNILALPIGWILSHVLLIVVYFGLITPIGLVMKLIGRDALARRLDPDAETYWTETEPQPPAGRYFRQF